MHIPVQSKAGMLALGPSWLEEALKDLPHLVCPHLCYLRKNIILCQSTPLASALTLASGSRHAALVICARGI
eukprot:10314244-Alexandrium_andersonii.AAC.1